MRRRRDDPGQALFRWFWSDPADEKEDDDPPAPLATRVRARHGPSVKLLWGVPVMVARTPNAP